jgi:hypothetical protein
MLYRRGDVWWFKFRFDGRKPRSGAAQWLGDEQAYCQTYCSYGRGELNVSPVSWDFTQTRTDR